MLWNQTGGHGLVEPDVHAPPIEPSPVGSRHEQDADLQAAVGFDESPGLHSGALESAVGGRERVPPAGVAVRAPGVRGHPRPLRSWEPSVRRETPAKASALGRGAENTVRHTS